jgi:hypothetical protein
MLATFFIETTLALYIGLRYSSGVFRALAIVLLVCLASFQLAEYQVCVGPAAWALTWGKIGLAGITLLPALGMHLIGTVTRKSPLITAGYCIAGMYEVIFLVVPGATGQPECGGNYVIIQIAGGWFSTMYSFYYFAFMLLAVAELASRLTSRAVPPNLGFSKKLIALMLAGYLSFMIPMAITSMISPELRRATPSIMCGFALMLALILAIYVAPLYGEEARALKLAAL